jgi:hypothetical protein
MVEGAEGSPGMSHDSVSESPVQLPYGILTFLLTDIEGSTELWELHAAAMGAALARHEALIEATVTSWRHWLEGLAEGHTLVRYDEPGLRSVRP